MKPIFKFIGFILIVISYSVSTLPFYLLSKVFRYSSRKVIVILMMIHAKMTLKLLSVEYKVTGFGMLNSNSLIVANHLSYLDILVMASHFPTCFVTSIEIKRTPFLGQLCDLGGCLYVERRNKDNISIEILDITNALKNNLNVVIFPEATSTNGDEVKRFKRPLFQSAMDAQKPITPVTLNYLSIDGEILNTENRDDIFWYDDMSFLPHFLNLLKKKSIRVELKISAAEVSQKFTDVSSAATYFHKIISNSHIAPIAI